MDDQPQRKRKLSTSQDIVEFFKRPRPHIDHEMVEEPEEVPEKAASRLIDGICPNCVETGTWFQDLGTVFYQRRILQNGPIPGCQGCQFFELMKFKPIDGRAANSYDLVNCTDPVHWFLRVFEIIPSDRRCNPDYGRSGEACRHFFY